MLVSGSRLSGTRPLRRVIAFMSVSEAESRFKNSPNAEPFQPLLIHYNKFRLGQTERSLSRCVVSFFGVQVTDISSIHSYNGIHI